MIQFPDKLGSPPRHERSVVVDVIVNFTATGSYKQTRETEDRSRQMLSECGCDWDWSV